MAERDVPDSEFDALVPYATPFNSECRAFGRLKEVNREDLAVRVYGYTAVYLTEEIAMQMTSAFGTRRSKPITAFTWGLTDPSQPIMSIVKDWLGDDDAEPYWQRRAKESKFFPRIYRNLLGLHTSGIVVRDLEAQQYINGVLVDLGQSWTIPHIYDPEFGQLPSWTFASLAAWDLLRFSHMVLGWNLIEWPEAQRPRPKKSSFTVLRNQEACDHLRPRVYRQRPFLPILNYDGADDYVMADFPPFDPARFDWRKAVRKGTGKRLTSTKRNAADEPQTTQSNRKRKMAKCNKACFGVEERPACSQGFGG